MPIAWKSKTLLLAFCAVIAMMPATAAAPFATAAGESFSDDQDQKAANADSKADSEEEAEDESAPAALEIDVSTSSPLIQELYQATRKTRKKTFSITWQTRRNSWTMALT
jgi:hypothetical protein